MRYSLSHGLLLAALGFLLPPLGRAQVQPFAPVLETALLHDDNLGRAASAADRREDTAFRLGLSGGDARVLARDWLLTYGASARVTHWNDYDDFDTADIRADFALRRRFGLGPTAPGLTARASGGPTLATTPGLEGWAGLVGLTFGQRPNVYLRYALNAELTRTDTRDAFFANTARTLGAELDVLPHDQWKLSFSARHRHGTVLSFARPPAPWRNNSAYLASVPVRPAPDFFSEPLNAYTLVADTRSVGLALAWAPTSRYALTLAFDYADTRRDGLRYLNRTTTLGLARRF
jgi:hypothetical protein